MMRPNTRTKNLVDDWVAFGMAGPSDGKPGTGPSFRDDIHDQDGLGLREGHSWTSCGDSESCAGV